VGEDAFAQNGVGQLAHHRHLKYGHNLSTFQAEHIGAEEYFGNLIICAAELAATE
jgi:hypothetical protein